MIKLIFLFLFSFSALCAQPKVLTGVDVFFQPGHQGGVHDLKGCRVGLITNQTGMNRNLKTTIELFREHATNFKLVALFSPEHGIDGLSYAGESINDGKKGTLRVYSLHGKTRRPTKAMLEGIDVLVFDIQDIGSRSYTYASTLYYVMEEAAKVGIEVIVLDRPNPMNGLIVDGPMLQENLRSFVGYINVPYCHGMTLGELAHFFNTEYHIGCSLKVILMQGWKREMNYRDTGLLWIPLSPQIPEMDTPFFYPTTGILGELGILNIGVGYTLPFKIVGAPWIVDANRLALELNAQKLPGVKFIPFHFKPFFGVYKEEECHGVKIEIMDSTVYRPVSTGYMICGILKSLYPKLVEKKLGSLPAAKRKFFSQVSGSESILEIFTKEQYPAWKLVQFQAAERKAFLVKREKYLLY